MSNKKFSVTNGLDVNHNPIINLPDPINPEDAVNKQYTDSLKELSLISFQQANDAIYLANSAYFIANSVIDGYTGSQGDIGYTGSQGNIGYTGSQGDIGYTGSVGYTGSSGEGSTLIILDNLDSDDNRYIVFTANSSGQNFIDSEISSSKLYYNANTGTLFANIFNSLSDESLKENVSTLQNSLEIIDKINPVSFTWKDSGKKSYGIIAQELEKVLPELVITNNGVKSVEYNSLIAFLLESIKELHELIKEK